MFLAALGMAAAPLSASAAEAASRAGSVGAASAAIPTSPAAAKSPASAYFVTPNGAVYSYGRSEDGTWQAAAPVDTKMTAPPGAPIASARLVDGTQVAFYVGDDGAIWGGCGSMWRMTLANLLRPGTPLTVAVTPTVVMLLYSTDQGQWSGMHVESEIHHPCGVFTDPLPPLYTESLPGTWHVPTGTIAATGLSDGEIGVIAVDVAGALHASWRSPYGAWTDRILTAADTSAPGSGIASTASPVDSSLTLFYASRTGQAVVAQVDEGAGLRGNPVSAPWGVPKIPAGGAIGAASSSLGYDVSYVATGGTAIELQADTAATWRKAMALGPSGFAKDGRPVAVTATADEIDVYCGTATGVPGHFGVPPHTGGGASWRPAGSSGLIPPSGGIAAS